MAFDGIVTKHITQELKKIISYKIYKIYEPNKNTILLGLYKGGKNLSLLICISANSCRLHLTSHEPSNPSAAPNFCMLLRKHLIGFKVKDIYSADLERIVFIELENNENPNKPIYKKLMIELMGKHSNIILTNENGIIIDSMRHTSVEENATRDIYPTTRYILPKIQKYNFLALKNFEDFYAKIEPKFADFISLKVQNINNLSISNFELDKIISSTFNGISLAFVQNIIKKLNITAISKDALEIVYNKIKEIINAKNLAVLFTDNKKDYFLYTCSLQNLDDYNLNFTIDNFYFEKESSELFKNYRNSLLNLILATLKKYEKRLEHMDSKLLECKNMDKYKLYGELIISNLYKIPSQNLSSVKLENYYNNNEPILIPLNKQYLPAYNAKMYFKKYSKLKNALEVVNLQKKETIQDINYIESVIYELDNCKTLEDVEAVYAEISENNIFKSYFNLKNTKTCSTKNKKPKSLTKNKYSSFNPLKYTVLGFTVLVGRNNVENDYLTCKFASKNDIWFHTKDIHGSHVVLKTNPNDVVPPDVLFEVAKIAAKHSKAKNSSNVPVDFCKVCFVKKPSGSKPRFCNL